MKNQVNLFLLNCPVFKTIYFHTGRWH